MTLWKKVEAYLAGLTLSQGRSAGQKFPVLPWQKRFLRGSLAPNVQYAGLSISRGNGKTTFSAGLAAASLNGPLAMPRSQTLLVASSFSQAKIGFDHVLNFMGEELADTDVWRVIDSTQRAWIQNRRTGSELRCLGSDPRHSHGLAPSLVLADEPSQWAPSKSESMLAALKTAGGKQPRFLFLALGTRPSNPSHWFEQMLTGAADYAQVHKATSEDPPFQRRTWAKANPSLSAMPDLQRAIKGEIRAAKQDESAMASFRALRLNLGVSDSAVTMLLESATWLALEGEAERAGPMCWGIDLGTTAALSAVACYWPATGRLEALALVAEVPSLEERGRADSVGGLYLRLAERGDLITGGHRHADPVVLVREALNRWGRPVAISCDRWRADELRDALDLAGVPSAALSQRGQGWFHGSQDVRAFRLAALSGRLTPVKSLLMRAAMSEARTVSDQASNAKLAKNSQGGRRMNSRDDAAAAAILAVAAGMRGWREERPSAQPVLGVIRRA